tara:strand:- start:1384 stop:2118 length:735 start_codon:yes stop_codon:yes gene_type:complete
MKKIILSIAMISSLGLIADDHLPENFSKYQSNFLFSCPMPNACLAAFDEYMNSPEVKSQNYEVDVYAVLHNGWDDATHGVSWYYKNADEYAKSNLIFATSDAGKKFRAKLNEIGVEQVQENLSVHTIGVSSGGPTTDNAVSLRWSMNVTNPAEFLPLWTSFSKSLEKYDWSANAYGLQSHYLGNNGTGITHEIWAAFSSPQAALAFLDGMLGSKEFAEYSPKQAEYSEFIRSYMEVSLNMYNPD